MSHHFRDGYLPSDGVWAALKNFTSTLSASRDFDPKTSGRVFSIACVSAASYEMMPKVMQLIAPAAPHCLKSPFVY
ncbi:hypothetical protein OH492_17465 [Vibrio chagasii]|nr:hypothetical protein [Vibrio chagasii]